MEENNNNVNNEFKNVENNNSSNSAYKAFKNSEKKTNGTSVGKTVVLPFVCGVLGTVAVLGTCLTVPPIKQSILNSLVGTSNNQNSDSTNLNNLNTQQVSLLDFSETGIGVANKVKPSIVGITVEFSVNSISS